MWLTTFILVPSGFGLYYLWVMSDHYYRSLNFSLIGITLQASITRPEMSLGPLLPTLQHKRDEEWRNSRYSSTFVGQLRLTFCTSLVLSTMLTLMYIFVLGLICTTKWTFRFDQYSSHPCNCRDNSWAFCYCHSKRGKPLTVYLVVSAASIKLPTCNLHYILSGPARLKKGMPSPFS